MYRKPSAAIAALGVAHISKVVIKDLGWLFREQPTEDYGIDAHIEVVDGTSVRGRLLAVQIKSGDSYFGEPTKGGWWFRPDQAHVDYWLRHSLPVIVVLFDPDTETCYWQLVSKTTLDTAKTGSPKLLIPSTNVLGAASKVALRAAADGDPYDLRLRELRLALPWMRRLEAGQRLVIDVEEWVNKTSGRGDIELGIDHEDGKDPEVLAKWGVWFGLSDYGEVLPNLLAWADLHNHEETYDEADSERREGDGFWVEGDWYPRVSSDEWAAESRPDGLRPYTVDGGPSGEVDMWRLELTLNTLGKAFLAVDEFATTGLRQLAVEI